MSKQKWSLRYRLISLVKDLIVGTLAVAIALLFWHFVTEAVRFLVELTRIDVEWFSVSWQRTVLGGAILLVTIILLGRILQALFGQRLATTPGFRRLARSGQRLATEIDPKASQAYKVVLGPLLPDQSRKIAILTSVLEDAETGRKLATVFFPNTPNVRTGETHVVELDRVTMTTWTVSEAVTFLMSGGAVGPSKIHFDTDAPE